MTDKLTVDIGDPLTIDPQRVEAIMHDCLAPSADGALILDSLMGRVAFDESKVAIYRDEIGRMLDMMDDNFKESGGGGMSLLQGCADRNGEQWTGLQLRVGELFALGEAAGKAKLLLPREVWPALPGHMPYYVVMG